MKNRKNLFKRVYIKHEFAVKIVGALLVLTCVGVLFYLGLNFFIKSATDEEFAVYEQIAHEVLENGNKAIPKGITVTIAVNGENYGVVEVQYKNGKEEKPTHNVWRSIFSKIVISILLVLVFAATVIMIAKKLSEVERRKINKL